MNYDERQSLMPKYWKSHSNVRYDEANSILSKLNIVGRKIKGVYSLDHCYTHSVEDIEDNAYYVFEEKGYPEEECHRLANFSSIPLDTPMQCLERIDMAMRFLFEDGDVLNIDTGYGGFKADLNGIPVPLEKRPPIDLDVLFHNCLGKEIARVECQHFEEICFPEMNMVKVSFIFADNTRLTMEPWIDYVHVFYETENGEILTIPFEELKKGLTLNVSEFESETDDE